jgi:hypothetical protein
MNWGERVRWNIHTARRNNNNNNKNRQRMQQQERKMPNDDTGKERKKGKRASRKKERDNGLAEARILVVIPAASNFKFNVPLNPAGKYKATDDSLPRRFEK